MFIVSFVLLCIARERQRRLVCEKAMLFFLMIHLILLAEALSALGIIRAGNHIYTHAHAAPYVLYFLSKRWYLCRCVCVNKFGAPREQTSIFEIRRLQRVGKMGINPRKTLESIIAGAPAV